MIAEFRSICHVAIAECIDDFCEVIVMLCNDLEFCVAALSFISKLKGVEDGTDG